MATDFTDETPAPNPTPKKHYTMGPHVLGEIPWPAGQTFQQALGAAFPAVVKNKTNLTDFVIHASLEAIEL